MRLKACAESGNTYMTPFGVLGVFGVLDTAVRFEADFGVAGGLLNRSKSKLKSNLIQINSENVLFQPIYLVFFIDILFLVRLVSISGEDSSAATVIFALAFMLDSRRDIRLGVDSVSIFRLLSVFCSVKPTLRFGVSEIDQYYLIKSESFSTMNIIINRIISPTFCAVWCF